MGCFGGARNLGRNFRARAETWVNKLLRRETFEGSAIDGEACGFSWAPFVPLAPEPAQILDDCAHIPLAGALRIEVLDPQQEPPARCSLLRTARGKRVAQMKVACWTGRKTRDNHVADLQAEDWIWFSVSARSRGPDCRRRVAAPVISSFSATATVRTETT